MLKSVIGIHLSTIRQVIEGDKELAGYFSNCIAESQRRLQQQKRTPREDLGDIDLIFKSNVIDPEKTPNELVYEPKSQMTLRGALGNALGYLNKQSGGAFLGAAADLYGSTSLAVLNKHFPDGFYNPNTNPKSRMISAGGICEDAMGAVMTGIAAYGNHVSVAASYAAFIAAFEHVAARVHCIGQQLKQEFEEAPYHPFIMINGHAGVKTGEDGPTHADPQALQLLQENFAPGTAITLTPWEPNEVWPLLAAALRVRPALLAPFVTRPNETIIDRKALGLADASDARYGVYALLKADPKQKQYHGTIVLQGSECGYAFVTEALSKLREAKLNLNVYYVASNELFDTLPKTKRDEIFPPHLLAESMAISGFTLPTLYRWVGSDLGRRHSLYPFKNGHYLGSGKADMVVKQAGLHGEAQFEAISRFAEAFASSRK